MFRFTILLLLITHSLYADFRVLALSGSLREDSLNTKLVKESAYIAKNLGACVTIFDLKANPLPFFDQDIETSSGMPENAKKLRRLMIESDLIIIASPNYNSSYSGVLKNALDWATRNEKAQYCTLAFKGKKFLIMSASSGSSGGSGGLISLNQILGKLQGVVDKNLFSLPFAHQAFDANGHLIDSQQKAAVTELIRSQISLGKKAVN